VKNSLRILIEVETCPEAPASSILEDLRSEIESVCSSVPAQRQVVKYYFLSESPLGASEWGAL
jgi:hypothetical protein